MTPENKKLLARMNKARDFPAHTCPASRHAAMIAEHLAKGKPYPMLQEEPEHVAGTIASVVASLWEARQAVADEREACARVAEEWKAKEPYVAHEIAAAIRARGKG